MHYLAEFMNLKFVNPALARIHRNIAKEEIFSRYTDTSSPTAYVPMTNTGFSGRKADSKNAKLSVMIIVIFILSALIINIIIAYYTNSCNIKGPQKVSSL